MSDPMLTVIRRRRIQYGVLAGAAAILLGATAVIGTAVAQPEPRSTATPDASPSYGTATSLFPANSPWNTPIADGVAVDPKSDEVVDAVLNSSKLVINLDLISYGQPFYTATASTPRVVLGGRNPVGAIPIDPSWTPNGGADAKMNVIDPSTHSVYELQGYVPAKKTVYWVVRRDYTTSLADGYPADGLAGPTGSGMSQAAGTIRTADLEKGSIDHALSFISSNPVPGFRYPASQSDGTGSGVGIQEGMRVQLDPSVNVDKLPGLTPGERMIAKALQRYGAYCTDTGRGSDQAMGFYVEKPNPSTQALYDKVGLTEDWQVLDMLPRNDLRVLATSATPKP